MHIPQLKDMAERLPPGVYENDQITPVYMPNGVESHTSYSSDLRREGQLRNDATSNAVNSSSINSVVTNGLSLQNHLTRNALEANELSTRFQNNWSVQSNKSNDNLYATARDSNAEPHISSSRAEDHDYKETEPRVNGENSSSKSRISAAPGNQVEAEWIEQYEPGVYITLVALRDGTRDLKRVRFRYFHQTFTALCIYTCSLRMCHVYPVEHINHLQPEKVWGTSSRDVVVGKPREGL